MSGRIDVHVHVITDTLNEAIKEAGGDPSGWVIPTWSVESALKFNSQAGVSLSVLSVTSPGPAIAGTGEKGRTLARKCNDEVYSICESHPENFRFFASTPSWEDVTGCLEEIDYIFTKLRTYALGIVVMTSYGDKLLGDPAFIPIWEKLNKYKSIVFVHPSAVNIKPHKISGFLPQPIIDYPIATTRTAVDLVYSGTMKRNPNVSVILSHAGGTLPFLMDRAALLLGDTGFSEKFGISLAEFEAQMKRFWVDLAISGTEAQLSTVKHVFSPDKVLYGSDFPYAPLPIIQKYNGTIDKFIKENGGEWHNVNRENALKLFQQHGFGNKASL